MKTFFENEGVKFQRFIAENPVYSLLRHADGVTVCTDEGYEPSPVPVLVYRSQLDLVLSDIKLTGKGYVFEADEVLRDDTRVAQNLSKLNSDEIDSLFRLAATK